MDQELYTEYENLILKRDKLDKEAGIYLTQYIREFGELATDVFKLKIECIELKKSVTFCQKALNTGKKINKNELQNFVKSGMDSYYAQLQQMIEDAKECKNPKVSKIIDVEKSKRIYRSIAKKIHPDINPKTNDSETLLNLWNKAVEAYNKNDSNKLEELEILVNAEFKKLGIDIVEIKIDNLEIKIDKIKAEIDKIKNTNPYQFKYLLENEDSIEDKRNEFLDDLAYYEDYKMQLQEMLLDFNLTEEVEECQMN